MWLGESACTLDDKSRVFLPRKYLGGFGVDAEGRTVVILTRGFEGCLFLFSEAGFQAVLARLETQAFAGAEARRMQRLFFANTHRTTLDAQGRLLVPEKLKSLLALGRDVVLVGAIDRIEVWSKAGWDAFEAANVKQFDRLDHVLCGNKSGASAPDSAPAP
jgi:MraZ protein